MIKAIYIFQKDIIPVPVLSYKKMSHLITCVTLLTFWYGENKMS